MIPQVTTANQVGEYVQELQEFREDLSDVIARAEAMHDDPAEQAELLTSEGADAMAEVRNVCDALELSVADEVWPLPKYREMLFPFRSTENYRLPADGCLHSATRGMNGVSLAGSMRREAISG